jgi:hypothetical protein
MKEVLMQRGIKPKLGTGTISEALDEIDVLKDMETDRRTPIIILTRSRSLPTLSPYDLSAADLSSKHTTSSRPVPTYRKEAKRLKHDWFIPMDDLRAVISFD